WWSSSSTSWCASNAASKTSQHQRHRPRHRRGGASSADTAHASVRVGPVTAARALGEVSDVARFRSLHHFGPTVRPVHPTTNPAIHIVAVPQIRIGDARSILADLEGMVLATPSSLLRVQLHYARGVLAAG